MESIIIMAVASVLGSLLTAWSTNRQHNKEFAQQEDLLESEQEFQRERDQWSFENSTYSAKMEQGIAAGFNPNMLAASLLSDGSAAQVTGSSSPSAPNVNSAISALTQGMGLGQSELYDLMKNQAEIKNIQSQTNKNEVEAGLMPRDFKLREMSTEAQINLWNKTAEKVCADAKLTAEETKLVEQQNMYYGRKTEAEIMECQAAASQAFANAMQALDKIKSQEKERDVMDADIMLKNAETSNVRQDTRLKMAETEKTWKEAWSAESKGIMDNFEKEFTLKYGISFTADFKEKVYGYIQAGEIDKAQNMVDAVFNTALNQAVGDAVGTATGTPRKTSFGLPFNLYSDEEYNFGNGNPYTSIPIWNPNDSTTLYRLQNHGHR